MGRVAKYKKVKSFDPYSKKNGGKVDLPTVGIWGLGDDGRKIKKRSQKAERMRAKKNKDIKRSTKNRGNDDGGFDAPPTEADEFDMTDLMGSVKKQNLETNDILGVAASASASSKINTTNNKNTSTDEVYDKVVLSTGNVANIPKTDRDETKVTRLLRLDKQEEQKSEREKQVSQARMEGESKRAYSKRTKAETRLIIKQSMVTKNHEKLQRKKDFMNNKKKNKKRKGGTYSSFHGDVGDGDGNNYDESNNNNRYNKDVKSFKEDIVQFGEQAERPPVFRNVPRGVVKSQVNKTTKAQTTMKVRQSKGMSDDQVELEKKNMEVMRRRVQAQYAAIKSRRKNEGDFHL
mmetsp:Transcript_6437/g.7410  ORF Transcript_6437/g.7410 Transcript_6437/m.7410 type:complete len:347 (+) Transcript_6437:45-1085(+)